MVQRLIYCYLLEDRNGLYYYRTKIECDTGMEWWRMLIHYSEIYVCQWDEHKCYLHDNVTNQHIRSPHMLVHLPHPDNLDCHHTTF